MTKPGWDAKRWNTRGVKTAKKREDITLSHPTLGSEKAATTPERQGSLCPAQETYIPNWST